MVVIDLKNRDNYIKFVRIIINLKNRNNYIRFVKIKLLSHYIKINLLVSTRTTFLFYNFRYYFFYMFDILPTYSRR